MRAEAAAKTTTAEDALKEKSRDANVIFGWPKPSRSKA